MMNKFYTILLLLVGIGIIPLHAQELFRSELNIQPKNIIWTGTGNISIDKAYQIGNNFEANRTTNIDMTFKRINVVNQYLGIGLNGFTDILIADNFSGIEIGAVALGPVFRGFLYEHNAVNIYTDLQLLMGYDLSLGDALNINTNDSWNMRPGLRAGISYAINKRTGIYAELGPDWESELRAPFNFGAKALQFNIGIQFIK